jgi:beta-N-acetylhexosaminidase
MLAMHCSGTGAFSDEALRERVGQMLIIGFRGTKIDENSYIVKTVNALNTRGIVLFYCCVPSRSFTGN